ncbi:MAG TPA: stage V sporulation protein AA [Candidatus Merdenecus merdavium]|nr:stage V sporulation protein AA [Candidatus Merdenecus merdavium]
MTTNPMLYMKIEQNIEVHKPLVTLGDVVTFECANQELVNKLKTLKLVRLEEGKRGRYVVSVMKVITTILKEYPNLDINPIGEADFIITYETKKRRFVWLDWTKTAFVCLTTFFGAGFSIMTFNNDVDIPKLFGQLYYQFTGQVSDGFGILEVTYSLGLGIGVLVFFNRFGRKSLTKDPSPIEVEMRLYEDDINRTLIEERARREANSHVDESSFARYPRL